MNRRTLYWINILVPLLFGVIVYLYWMPDAYISRMILRFFHISYATDRGKPEGIGKFIRYYLSDICWAYALTVSLALYLGRHSLVMTYIISTIFVVLIELLQLLPQTPGYFDIFDIIAEVITSTVTIFIINLYERRNIL